MKNIKNLAIIDDDKFYSYIAEKIIYNSGQVNKVIIFKNGLDAINFLKVNTDTPDLIPDIILLDLAMPVMDGWHFLEEYILLKPNLDKPEPKRKKSVIFRQILVCGTSDLPLCG